MGLFDAPKTTTNTSPYPGITTGLNKGLSDALDLYKKQRLNPYTATDTLTRGGLEGLRRQSVNSIKPLNESLARFRSMALGSGDISSQGQLGIAQRAMGPSLTEKNLSGVANGDFIGLTDPNYERLRQRAQENAATEAGMVASGIGRSGSDYHQSAVARQVGDTTAGMDMARLKEEQDRQFQANSLIDQLRQSGLGIGLNAQNSASAIQAGNQDRRFNANNEIPGAVAATFAPYQQITDIGRAKDVDRVNKNGTAGTNLASLMQILGIASPYGTTTTTEPDNKTGGLIGGGLGLASLLFG